MDVGDQGRDRHALELRSERRRSVRMSWTMPAWRRSAIDGLRLKAARTTAS